jgi:hypothetical protein
VKKKSIKRIGVILLLASCAGITFAQAHKLSAPFSKASIQALRAINSTGWALPTSIGELEARQADAQARMEAAKAAAQSQDDADAFIYLQRFQLRHSQNFADYTNAITARSRKMTGKDTLQRAAALVAKDPKLAARKNKETECAAALEKTLQSRNFSAPAACDLY